MLQSVLAPMVLENLNCTGAEARLVDCPGIMIETETVYSDYNLADIQASFTYYGGGEPVCDPLLGTFAYVACGTQTGPGVSLLPCLLLHPFFAVNSVCMYLSL